MSIESLRSPGARQSSEIAKRLTIQYHKHVDAFEAWSAEAIAMDMASFADGIRRISTLCAMMMLP